MAVNKQTDRHTHAREQCSHASVGLTQAHPNYRQFAKFMNSIKPYKVVASIQLRRARMERWNAVPEVSIFCECMPVIRICNTMASSAIWDLGSIGFVISRGKRYHILSMSNSHKCTGVNGEALQLHSVYKKPYCKLRENPYQYYKSRENPYQVLQVTRAASECAIKFVW